MNRNSHSVIRDHAAPRLRAAVAAIAARRQRAAGGARAANTRAANTRAANEGAAGAAASVDMMSLSPVERWRRAFAALAKAVDDPGRTDVILEFSMYANAGTMARRIERFFDDPRYRRLYEERRAIDSKTIDLDRLGRLPEGTLGRAYADFMRSRGLTPEIFDEAPRAIADPRAVYVIQRMRQTHDLWHVVTGYEPDLTGEIALQAFTFAQVRAPSALLLAAAGMLHSARSQRTFRGRRRLRRDVAAGFRAGLRAEKLALFPWEDHWETPLAELRARLGVQPLQAGPGRPSAS